MGLAVLNTVSAEHYVKAVRQGRIHPSSSA